MEIRRFQVLVRAQDFDRSCRFYSEVLALPRLHAWDREDSRGALFQAGSGIIELRGRPHGTESEERDEAYDFQGPERKVEIVLLVGSVERVYEELVVRDKNIPGGLQAEADGSLVFATHDPDGVRIIFRQVQE